MPTETAFPDLALYRELDANIAGFCRVLRRAGSGVGPAEQRDAVEALLRLDLGDAEAFRLGLRTTLAKDPEETRLFDRYFALYWMVWDRAAELNRRGQAALQEEAAQPKPPAPQPQFVSVSDWLKQGEATEDESETAAYSPFEVVTQRDFSRFSDAELAEVGRLVRQLARRLATRFNRRYAPGYSGRLDLRRTLRAGLRRGGELVDLAYRKKRRKRLKLVLLCDVSKSMDLYSRFLVQFIFAFQQVYRRIESFVFSTGLHRVTPLLREEELAAALGRLGAEVRDWSGGTRIGAALEAFERRHAGLVDRQTVVLLVSDGWDTGDTAGLVAGMERLQRRSRCLIWLNPLMGSADFAPTAKGMAAALPYVDVLAPAHNIASLRQLVEILGQRQRGGIRRAPRPAEKKETAAPAVAPPARIHPLLAAVKEKA